MTAPKGSIGLLVIAVLGPTLPAQTEPTKPNLVIQSQGPAKLAVSGPFKEPGLLISLADLLHLSVSVEGSSSLKVEGGGIVASDGWKVQPNKPSTTLLPKGGVRWQQVFVLDPLKPGKHELRLEPLRHQDGGGDWVTVNWKPLEVTVLTQITQADVRDLRDITAIEDLPSDRSGLGWWIWPLIAAAALTIGGGAFWLRQRRRQTRPPLTPQQWADRELERLLALGLPEKGAVERFHTLLSNVVRGYLEKRFYLRARRQTTPEFLRAMADSPQLSAEQQEFLRGFLQQCDLAKFAQFRPSSEECQERATAARAFVAQTSAERQA
jgi:hypothetical protein